MENTNLQNIGYLKFVDFLFDRPVVPTPHDLKDKREPWYWHVETQFDPSVIAEFYIRLFSDPSPLLSKFSDEQLEQAFWAIPSCNLDCGLGNLIWEPQIAFETRAKIVRAMFHLFEKLFAANSLDSSVGMWWDALAYDWHCGNKARANGGEDLLMQDVMFETLTKIIGIPSKDVHFAALHGLGHLHHPDTPKFIKEWLGNQNDIDPELVVYAHAAAKFEVR